MTYNLSRFSSFEKTPGSMKEIWLWLKSLKIDKKSIKHYSCVSMGRITNSDQHALRTEGPKFEIRSTDVGASPAKTALTNP